MLKFIYSCLGVLLIISLAGCKTYNFSNPPSDCYPDFIMHINRINLDPLSDRDLRYNDSLSIYNVSGVLCIRKQGYDSYSSGLLRRMYITDYDSVSNTIIVTNHQTMTGNYDDYFSSLPMGLLWEIAEQNEKVNITVTSFQDSTFVQRASGRIQYLERNKRTKSVQQRIKNCSPSPRERRKIIRQYR